MKIDGEKCIACRSCVVYCSVEAIKVGPDGVYVDQDACVECGACLKSGVCAYDALHQPELGWSRILRAQFSDPLTFHPDTEISGRGTSEMKTNDVTGRFKEGEVGFAVEMGRPGISSTFADVQRVTTALADKVQFEPLSPVTGLIDPETGEFKDPSILGEKGLSIIVECKTVEENGFEVLERLRRVAREIETVFTLCVVVRCRDHGIPFKEEMERHGFEPLINGKTNVGLGRPLA